MIEPGQAGAYLTLFSEMGLVLLVTTLSGALAGIWIDTQLGSSPVASLAGFILGASIGARAMYRMIMRFLARFD